MSWNYHRRRSRPRNLQWLRRWNARDLSIWLRGLCNRAHYTPRKNEADDDRPCNHDRLHPPFAPTAGIRGKPRYASVAARPMLS